MYSTHLVVSSLFSHDLVDFFQLGLSSLQSTQSLLGQLLSSLFTRVSQQFNQSSFVWSQTTDFSDNISDKRSSLGESTLSVGNLWGNSLGGDDVTFVQTNSNTCKREMLVFIILEFDFSIREFE